MADLTIVLTGPKTTDIRVFIDGYRVNGLQKLGFVATAAEMIPSVELKFPFIRLWREEIPRGDGYVTIKYDEIFSVSDNFRMITVRYGDTLIGMINKLDLLADVTESTHTFVLEYKKAVIEMDMASDLRELLYNLPDWINVVIQE